MTNILRIDASSRPPQDPASGIEGSYSRELADYIIRQLSNCHPHTEIVSRDLAAEPLPHISNKTIQGYYTPDEAMTEELLGATALSDRLISEIEHADILVLSVPIYNFSVPSAFKAWVDQIVRIGHTFAYEDGNFHGLVKAKRAYVCYAYGAGGYLNNGSLAHYDHMAPYVGMILNFIGITDVTTFAIEATTADASTIASQHDAAINSITEHFLNILATR